MIRTGALFLAAATCVAAAALGAPRLSPPARHVPDPGVIATHQALIPAGEQFIFHGRVYGVAFCGRDDEVDVLVSGGSSGLERLDWRRDRLLSADELGEAIPGMQGLACARGGVLYDDEVFRGRGARGRLVTASGATPIAGDLGSDAIAGVATAGRTALVALTAADRVAVVDLPTATVERTIRVGIAPFGVALSRTARVGYVSNWGGRAAATGDRSGPLGTAPNADRVPIDGRGVDATGTVSRIDTVTGTVTATIPVGLHPSGLWWDERRARLYVTDSNSDAISVVDTTTNRVVHTFPVRPFGPTLGVAPNGIVGNSRTGRLYVACGGINAIAVLRSSNGAILGLIPTGWYPVHVAMSSDGKFLAAGTLLGVGAGGEVPPFVLQYVKQETGMYAADLRGGRWVHDDRGTVSVLPIPSVAQLRIDTLNAVRANSPGLARPGGLQRLPIRYVVYIIKENRTYDQFFGNLRRGNGAPALDFYGDNEIPNHRRLALGFVLLDNFYASGGNSGDGHQWVTQAAETDYAYWPGYDGRSYPFDGSDAMAPAESGFIWNDAATHGESVAIFGEYAGTNGKSLLDRIGYLQRWRAGEGFTAAFNQVAPLSPVNRYVVHDFPGYGGSVPDVVRARIFVRHLRSWERSGHMPNLSILQLPADHTGGTTPGYSTPRACMADNDFALGEIVDALSHSRFWRHMAIFVVEDDAQSGVDHVDGHRTVALAISPYIRRSSVDSTFYDQASMLRTIEEVLHLPPMSMFDRISGDMRNSFTGTPDFAPYHAVAPRQSLFALNPPASSLRGQAQRDAVVSAQMDFTHADRAPAAVLNRILWRDAKGDSAPYPRE